MAHIRVRNDGDVVQVLDLGGVTIRVVPRGTALLPEGHYGLRIRDFTRIGRVEGPEDVPVVDPTAALLEEIAALKAELAAKRTPEPEPVEDDDVVYPQSLGHGKWRLSDGTETKGGTSRADAEAWEASLHD